MSCISKTAASINITGDTLDPVKITRLIGKKPTFSYRKGEEVPLRNGKGIRIAGFGAWVLKSERVTPGNLDAQIEKLLEGAVADTSVWLQISSEFHVRIFCGLFMRRFNEGLMISRSTMMLLGARGIALDLDIYGAEMSEDEAE